MNHLKRNIDITVSEVGPRDGLQSIPQAMPTEAKIRWIEMLAAAGVREIEVGSFVSPKLFPQLADTGTVVAAVRNIPGLKVIALVPNLKGAQMAAAAGVDAITMPVSASRKHSVANVGMTPEDAVEQVKSVQRWLTAEGSNIGLEVGISTAFGCSIQGDVPEDSVMRIAAELAAACIESIGLSDSTGYANPAQVRQMFKRLREEIGDKSGAAHFHNTRGLGLANVVAALDVGVTTFDASQGGIGGCPAAPGASGNIVTEDLVFLLESMGLRTGIDLERLIAARSAILQEFPGQKMFGHLANAGLPKNFRRTS